MTEYKLEDLYRNPITIVLPDGNRLQLSASGRMLLDGSIELDDGMYVNGIGKPISIQPWLTSSIRVRVEE